MKLIDTTKLRFASEAESYGFMKIDDEHIFDYESYDTLSKDFILGMKPLGRIYFQPLSNLDYTDGTPVESAHITGGEKGMIDKYLKPGKRVYTEEMVVKIINSRCYDDILLPKLPQDVYVLLKELSENKGKDKGNRARQMLKKYKVEGFEIKDKE